MSGASRSQSTLCLVTEHAPGHDRSQGPGGLASLLIQAPKSKAAHISSRLQAILYNGGTHREDVMLQSSCLHALLHSLQGLCVLPDLQ